MVVLPQQPGLGASHVLSADPVELRPPQFSLQATRKGDYIKQTQYKVQSSMEFDLVNNKETRDLIEVYRPFSLVHFVSPVQIM